MSMVTEKMKARAQVYRGDEVCREKLMRLIADMGLLPVGLLLTLLEDIEECGYVKEIGFVWLKHHHHKKEHKFGQNAVVWFDTEITAYFERYKIKNLTGVKAKELFIWISLSEIYVNGNPNPNPNPNGCITFKTPGGLSKSFPISLFQNDHWNNKDGQMEKTKKRSAICAVQV